MYAARPLLAVVVVAIAAAAIVSARPARTGTVRVDAVDDRGACAVDLSSGRRDCWEFSPEIPQSLELTVGHCYRARWAYQAKVPPHLAEVSCPPGR
ncbi:MAG: hypothetical protein WHS89_09770 [Acidimicrobiales bacterium]